MITMSGQMKSFTEKRESIESYIRESNLYEKKSPLNYDMRAYDLYIRENKLSVDEITPEIMKKFEKKE